MIDFIVYFGFYVNFHIIVSFLYMYICYIIKIFYNLIEYFHVLIY